MNVDLGIGLSAVVLIVGFPLVLLSFLLFLGRLEAWMLAPDRLAEKALRREVEQAERIREATAAAVPGAATPRTRRVRNGSRRSRRERRRAAATVRSGD